MNRYNALALQFHFRLKQAAYRVFTDYYRLLNKGIINKKDILKMLNPIYFWRYKYFRELYLL